MTSAASVPITFPVTAEDRLSYLRNRKIVVIDDAFDEPTREQLDANIVEEFLQQCGIDAEAKKELEKIAGSPVNTEKDLTDDVLHRIWQARGHGTNLEVITSTTIFAEAVDKLSNVTPFCEHLRKMGFTVLSVGRQQEPPTDGVGLLLIDYVLGPESRPIVSDSATVKESVARHATAEAIQLAQKVTRKFYDSYKDASEKPFIVLMSSRLQHNVLVDDFLESVGLIGGLFDFVTKGDLCNRQRLEFKLRTWNYALPSRHEIQKFADALTTGIDDVCKLFRTAVRALRFEDYAFVQTLTLQDDGHPLGDYMLWLYCSFLSDCLQSNKKVLDQRDSLDRLIFPQIIPSQDLPSRHLAKLYQSAIGASTVSGLAAHPLEGASIATSNNSEQGSNPLPYLQLGDVFVKDAHSEVLMVLNAACDLAFAPHATRKPDEDQSIILIPGRLTPLHEAPENMSYPRTELFELGDELYRIVWRTDRIRSIPHKDVVAKMQTDGYEHRYRLRLPYALLVQQQYAANLTRVGLPVAPPFSVAVDVELYCVDDDGGTKKICPPIIGGAYVIHRKRDNAFHQHLVLSAKCIQALMERLQEVGEQQLKPPAKEINLPKNVDGSVDQAAYDKAISKQEDRKKAKQTKIMQLAENHDQWFKIATENHKLPVAGSPVKLVESLLELWCESAVDGVWEQQRPIIVINVRYPKAPVSVTGVHSDTAVPISPEKKDAELRGTVAVANASLPIDQEKPEAVKGKS